MRNYTHRLDAFLKGLDRPRFILMMLVADWTLNLVLLSPLSLIFPALAPAGETYGSMLSSGLPPAWILAAVLLVAPTIETLLGQALPFYVLPRFKVTAPAWLIGCSAVWFGLQHVPGVGLGGFVNGFPSGILLAYTFWRWRQVDFTNAYWMTAGLHASMNLVATLLMLAVQHMI